MDAISIVLTPLEAMCAVATLDTKSLPTMELLVQVRNIGIVSTKRDLMHQDFELFKYSRSLKCPLHIASYALRILVSVVEF